MGCLMRTYYTVVTGKLKADLVIVSRGHSYSMANQVVQPYLLVEQDS
jgi:hypothetical protein